MSDTRDRLDIEVRRVAELEKELAEVEQSFEKYRDVAVANQHLLESRLQEAEAALRDIAKRDPESVWCYCSEVAEKALASISDRGGK